MEPNKVPTGDPFTSAPLPRPGKSALASKGVMGGVATEVSVVLLILAKRFAPEIPEAEAMAIISLAISGAIAVYGRISSDRPITRLF